MRRIISIVVVTALILSFGPSRPAEALSEKAQNMLLLLAQVIFLIGQQSEIDVQRDSILESTQNLQNRAIIEQRFDTTMYAHDHRPLSAGNRIDPTGITMTGAPEFSPGSLDFGAASAAFPEDYRKRAESLGKYAVGAMNANDADMDRLGRYQREALLPMVDALLAGDAKEDLKQIWKDEYEKMRKEGALPYTHSDPDKFTAFDHKSGEGGGKSDFFHKQEEILTGPGYRRTIQASGQAGGLKNHLMANIRGSLARQADADVRFAHNEQRERAEIHFAFEGAVGSWNLDKVNGKDY